MDIPALIGTELGPCSLLQVLGQGSTGAVFLADHAALGEQVAVKVVAEPSSLAAGERAAFLARFRRAVMNASDLSHPNILPVIEYGVQDGLAYLVMPYLGLEPLAAVMGREGPVARELAADYLDELSAALAYAHGRGILHGNITPSNVLKATTGSLMLTDFGQGTILRSPTLQAPGARAGVRAFLYLAPEQLLGGGLDARADQYALGVLLYQLLTGTTPYTATSASELLIQQLQQPPPSPRGARPDLSLECAQVMVRALARQPEQRFARVEELTAAFRLALARAPLSLGEPGERLQGAPLLLTAAATELPGSPEQPGEREAVSAPAPAPSITDWQDRQPLPQLATTPLGGRRSEQDKAERSPEPGVPEPSQGGRADGGPHTRPVPVLSPALAARQDAPAPAATVVLAAEVHVTGRAEEGQGVSTPSLPPGVGAFLSQANQGRSARRPWPVIRRPVSPRAFHRQGRMRQARRLSALVACLLVLVAMAGLLWGSLSTQRQARPRLPLEGRTRPVTLFFDPLSRPAHNTWWPTVPSSVYTFTQDAYLITGQSPAGTSAILATPLWGSAITSSITAREVAAGDPPAAFGILFRCNSQDEEGSPEACYSFEVTTLSGGTYRLYKYDARTFAARQAGPPGEWSLLWQHPIGREFHGGESRSNSLTVVAAQQTFTLLVNGMQVGQVVDPTFQSGMIGLVVGGLGTAVAFSRLLVTQP